MLLASFCVVTSLVTIGAALDPINCDLREHPHEENEDDVLCYCTNRSSLNRPYPAPKDGTAPHPKNASLTFGIYENDIYPIISWTVKGQYLNGSINGFYMQINVVPNGYYFYECTFNKAVLKDDSKLVLFRFEHCCRDLYNGLTDGDDVNVDIESLPLSHKGSQMYFVSCRENVIEKEINGSKSPKKKRRKGKGKKRKRKTRDKGAARIESEYLKELLQEREQSTRTSILIAIRASLCTLAVCGIAFCVIGSCFFRRYVPTQQRQEKRRRILFITDECDNNDYTKWYNRFIEAIKKCGSGDVEITTNIRSLSEVGSRGILTWIRDNSEKTDVTIMLICKTAQLESPDSTESQPKQHLSAVGVAVNIMESEALKSGFKRCKKKFIALHAHKDTYNRNSLLFCTHYLLHKDAKESIKHMLGEWYQQQAYCEEDINRLVGQFPKEQNQTDHEQKRHGAVKKKTTSAPNDLSCSLLAETSVQMNDLDRSVLYQNLGNSDQNNSNGEMPPSVENNSMI